MIELNGVTKSYNSGRVRVLKDVSLTVSDGEFVVILGASGSGKTTLMNVMSGLERADGGSVCACGRDLTRMTESELTEFRRENVGFIFQQYYLLPHLNVDANVRMGASLAGNEDYAEIICALGLESKRKCMPFELSGGEQQRVCIARALAKKPRLLFLDEPTGALDETTGREVLDCILKERAARGFTAVMVTHNENIAETAQTVVRMNSGRIISRTENASPKTAFEIGW